MWHKIEAWMENNNQYVFEVPNNAVLAVFAGLVVTDSLRPLFASLPPRLRRCSSSFFARSGRYRFYIV